MSSILHNTSRPFSGSESPRNPPHEARRQLSWLNYCAKNHRTCNEQWEDAFLPTRLVDVRAFPSIRLVNTKELKAEDQRYIALSYCWGPSMPDEGKTVLGTLEAHRKEIALEKLPKTLRDAIEVTRSLSFPFIWIDALCIIQDSRPDWEYELETMVKIYSCAYVTIAAGVADTCQGGFLQPPRVLGHLRTRSILPNRKKDSTDETWIPEFFNTPLFTRGWTLQERELSHRVIHFTSKFVIFECRYHIRRYEVATAHHYSFTMPLDLSNKYLLEPDTWQFRLFDNDENRTRMVLARGIAKGMNWNKVWHQLVAEYSTRAFTDQTDKLPAIAGLADRLQVWFKWTYVAGLWAENMPQELLWQRESSRNNKQVDVVGDEYVAPSWSWAAADFPVCYNHYELGTFGNSVVTILETNLVPAGSNTKGKLASGYIEMRARVKLLQARSAREPMGISQERFCRIYDTTIEGGEKDEVWIYWDRASEIEDESDVYIAVLMFREHGRQNGAGLALCMTDDGNYRRVGLAWYIGHPFIEGVEYSEIVII